MGWTPRAPDATTLHDAIYRVDRSRDEWLDAVRRAAAPSLGPSIAVVACAYSIDDAGIRLDEFLGGTRQTAASVLGLVHELRDAHERGGASACWVERRLRCPSAADTHLYGVPSLEGTPHGRWYSTFGARDAFTVHGFAPQRAGCVVGAFLGTPCARIDPGISLAWDRIGAHLSAALHLRVALERTEARAEACLKRSIGVREALRHAARVIDRASAGKLGDASRVLAAWSALVAGRWSLVDQFETDGRRFVVAKVNQPLLTSRVQLSARERQVVAHVALGHSNKHIAYELGLSLSTVAGALRRAERKLGKPTRIALIRHVIGSARDEPVRIEEAPASVSTKNRHP